MAAMSPSRKRLAASVLFCAILVLLLLLVGAVMKPARSIVRGDGGAGWGSYLSKPAGSVDVLFLGNSHIFDSVDPADIWKKRGISSYILGGPTQGPPITELYVREALRTQKPKVIVVEMSSADYDERNFNPQFHQINVGYMPWGLNKLKAALFATPAGERTGVLVDWWTYHTRWSEFRARDFNLLGKQTEDAFMNGFLPKARTQEVSSQPYVLAEKDRPAADEKIARNMPALRGIASAARDSGAEVLLLLTPTGPPNAYSYQLERVASQLQADFDNVHALDLSAVGAVPGLSFESDFFDGGHVSTKGSPKVSAAIADYLAERMSVPDRRGETALAEQWQADIQRHDALLEELRARQAK